MLNYYKNLRMPAALLLLMLGVATTSFANGKILETISITATNLSYSGCPGDTLEVTDIFVNTDCGAFYEVEWSSDQDPGAAHLWPSNSLSPSFEIQNGIVIYKLKVTENCTKNSDSVEITVIPTVVAFTGGNTGLCVDDSKVLGADPDAGISYSWTPASGLSATDIANPTVTFPGNFALPQLTYTLTADNGTGCIVEQDVNVAFYQLPEPDFAADTICSGNETTFENRTNNPASMSDYLWEFGQGVAFSTNENPTFQYAEGGEYSVDLTVVSLNGCEEKITKTVIVPSTPIIQGVVKSDPTDCSAENGRIIITAMVDYISTGGIEYSIDDGATWQVSRVFNGLGEGSFPVRVRNGIACETIGNTVMLTEPPAPVIIDVTQVNPTDCDMLNGTIAIMADGGTGSRQYSIDGVNWSSTSTFTNLGAGSYPALVRNSDGTCRVSNGLVVLSEPAAPIITEIIRDHTSNCGAGDGKITINTMGGALSHQYSITGGSTWFPTNEFDLLTATTYEVRVRNADGTCVVTGGGADINDPAKPIENEVFLRNPSDCDLNDGRIEIDATAGVGLPQYSIDGGNTWVTNNLFINRAPGTYDVALRNSDSTCLVMGSTVTLGAPSAIDANAPAFTHPTDCATNDGTITLTVNSGGAPVFSIDGGMTWTTDGNFTGLSPKTYDLRVRNFDETCEMDLGSLDLVAPAAPAGVTFGAVDPTVCNGTNGVIQFNGNGGSYQYSINNGANWQNDGLFTGLSKGDFILKVRNIDQTCETDLGGVELLAPPTILIQNVLAENVSNCGVTDGQISIAAEYTGTAALEYSIDGGDSWSANFIHENLAAGNYQIIVRATDATCLVTGPAEMISAPSAPTVDDVLFSYISDCRAADGTIFIIENNTNNFEASIDDGVTFEQQTIFTKLDTGDYVVKIRNLDGTCESTIETIELEEPIAPQLTDIQPIIPSGCGRSDGTLTLASNPNSGVDYSIDGGNTWMSSASFTGLPEGDYQAAVRQEGGGCDSAPQMFELRAAGNSIQLNVIKTEATCGNADAFFSINPRGQIPPFGGTEYSIDGGMTWGLDSIFSGLSAAIYYPAIRENDTCVTLGVATEVGISDAPEILNFNTQNPSHCQSADGNITITAAQDHATLEFSIDGGTTWQATNIFNGLTFGSYKLQVRLAGSDCVSTMENVFLFDGTSPVVTEIFGFDGECGNGGIIDIFATSPSGNTEYSIDNRVTWGSNSFITDVAPGTYLVRVRDALSQCEAYAGTIAISSASTPEIDTIFAQNPECNVNTGRIEISLKNALPGETQYSFNGGFAWQNENFLDQLFDGTYSVAARNMSNGVWCMTDVETVVLTKKDIPTFSLSMANPSDCGVDDGRITVNAMGSDTLEYSIDGMAWQRDNVLGGLAAGSYAPQIRYTDETCLTGLPPVTLTAPFAPTIDSIRSVAPDCNGGDGSITIFAQAGNMDLIYSVDNGNEWFQDSIIEFLPEGDYEILVANDNESCQVSGGSLRLDRQNMPVVDSIVGTPAMCAQADGSVEIFASLSGENLSILEFSIDSGRTWQSDNIFENLASQTLYPQIRRTDDNLCGTAIQAYFLQMTETPDILLVEKSNETDCGAMDGRIQIFAAGRNGQPDTDIEYSLNGTDWSRSAIFATLTAGDYTPQVRFLDGTCAVTDVAVTIEGPITPERTSIIVIDPGCDTPNGSIMVTASGSAVPPNAGIQYSLDGDNWFNTGEFTNLGTATYTVMFRYENNTCITSDTTINLAPRNLPEIMEITTDPASACGDSDGRISVTPKATGPGSPSIQFSLDGGVYQNSNIFTGVPPGTYVVSVRFADGTCEMPPQSVTVEAAETIEITAVTPTDVSNCGVVDGRIEITVNATSAVEYSLNGGAFQDAPIFENLDGGSYIPMVRLRDFNCTDADLAVTVNGAAPIFIENTVATSTTDCDANDGTITVQMLAGSPAVEFSIDNWATVSSTNLIENLAAGSYAVSARKLDGTCVTPFFNNPVIVESPEAPTVVINSTAPECFRDNGTISALGTAGNNPGNLSIEYSLDGTNWSPTGEFGNLGEDIYMISVRLENSACLMQMTETLTRPANCDDCDGVIRVDTLEVDLNLVDNPLCIPMRADDFANHTVTLDGNMLTSEGGCEPDSTYFYGYAPLAILGGTGGPFELRSWVYNGTTYSGNFANLDEVAAALDGWDTDNAWRNDASNFTINGGGIGNTYGDMELYSIPLDRSFNLMTNSFAEFQSFELTVTEAGWHEMIAIDNGTNCADTMMLFIEPAPDPCTDPVFTQSDFMLMSDNDTAMFCLPIGLLNFSDYNVILDGQNYTGATRPCDMDSVWTYLYFNFPGTGTDGPYNVTWTFGGNDFTGTVDDVFDLATMMNTWDPAGEWEVFSNIFSLVGKRNIDIAGDLTLFQVNSGLDATVMPDNGMISGGTMIEIIGAGTHRLTLENIADDCAETVSITIINQPTPETIRLTTAHATAIPNECLTNDELPGNVTSFVTCADAMNGVLTLDNLCFDYTPNSGFSGVETFCLVMCDDSNPQVCDTTFVEITVEPDLNCDVFATAMTDLEMTSCADSGQVCLPAIPNSLSNYTLFVDGAEYTDARVDCDIQIEKIYDLAFLPSGTVTLQNWTVNGMSHSGIFLNLNQLVDSLSSWDDSGDWMLNGFTLSGGNEASVYSDLSFVSGLGVLNIPVADRMNPMGTEITLSLGAHQIVAVSPTDCRDTLDVNIICPKISDIADTISVEVGEEMTLCLGDKNLNFDLNFINSVMNNCTSEEAEFTFDDVTNCLTIRGLSKGDDVACFEICLENGTCFTWTVNVEVTEDCKDFYPSDDVIVGVTCEPLSDVYVCLRGFSEEIQAGTYALEIDGVLYTGDLEPCGFDSTFSINYFSLPGEGNAGPYDITSWTINGEEFTGQFPTIDALVDSMNLWDPTGNWLRSDLGTVIVGGNPRNNYGPMTVEQTATGNPALLDFNTLIVPKGYGFFVPANGSYELTFIQNVGGCTDTVTMTTACVETETIEVTIFENEAGNDCLETDELPGNFTETFNLCSDASGDAVFFDWSADDNCFTYEGLIPGTNRACFIACDEFGVCDTTIYIVNVLSSDTTNLVAVNDSVTTTKGDPIVIDVAGNDTFGASIDTVYILNQPRNGAANLNGDFTISYIPAPDYCNDDEPDFFEYVVCNAAMQCDTARVEVLVGCSELLFISGFSPNGDGINETFDIGGVSKFPKNTLKIFNRWGNIVHKEDGYQNTWTGVFKSTNLPSGTYYYLFDTGEGDLHSGYLQIQR